MLESVSNISVTGTAASAMEAMNAIQRSMPDVVLMDLRMPEMEGTAAIRELRRIYPNLRILVLTNYETDAYIVEAFDAGAMGYLLKSTPQAELVQAVEMIHANERVIPPGIASCLMANMGRDNPSPRELEVLALVAKGLSNKEIANALFISDKTVGNHVASCLVKLGASDRTGAVTTAVKRGLIRITE